MIRTPHLWPYSGFDEPVVSLCVGWRQTRRLLGLRVNPKVRVRFTYRVRVQPEFIRTHPLVLFWIRIRTPPLALFLIRRTCSIPWRRLAPSASPPSRPTPQDAAQPCVYYWPVEIKTKNIRRFNMHVHTHTHAHTQTQRTHPHPPTHTHTHARTWAHARTHIQTQRGLVPTLGLSKSRQRAS